MERVEGDDGVEELVPGIPLLERRGDDVDLRERREIPPRELGHVRAQLDGEDREAALGERQRRLAVPQPISSTRAPGASASQLDEIVEDLGRRDGPCVVVLLGACVERRAQQVPLGVLGHAAFVSHRRS